MSPGIMSTGEGAGQQAATEDASQGGHSGKSAAEKQYRSWVSLNIPGIRFFCGFQSACSDAIKIYAHNMGASETTMKDAFIRSCAVESKRRVVPAGLAAEVAAGATDANLAWQFDAAMGGKGLLGRPPGRHAQCAARSMVRIAVSGFNKCGGGFVCFSLWVGSSIRDFPVVLRNTYNSSLLLPYTCTRHPHSQTVQFLLSQAWSS